MRTFCASIRKRDGELTALKYRHLKIDIKNDSEFASSNTVYAAVITDMKKKGFGAVEHKPAICPEDLVKLYDVTNVALSPNTHTCLLSKTWFDVMMYPCRRGRENLREMTRDTFLFQVVGSGRRYVMQVFF